MNVLSNVFNTCSVSLYADDAKLYAPLFNNSSVQDDINSLVKWCKDWRLNLNADRCFFIQYNPKSPSNYLYFIDNHPLQRQKEGKDLA